MGTSTAYSYLMLGHPRSCCSVNVDKSSLPAFACQPWRKETGEGAREVWITACPGKVVQYSTYLRILSLMTRPQGMRVCLRGCAGTVLHSPSSVPSAARYVQVRTWALRRGTGCGNIVSDPGPCLAWEFASALTHFRIVYECLTCT